MNNYNIDSITKIIISILQEKLERDYEYNISCHPSWDFSICKLIEKFKIQNNLFKSGSGDELQKTFADACWFLALQGIIRPSTIIPKNIGETTNYGANGTCFSITESGKEWLKKHTREYFIFTTAIQYTEIIKPFSSNFDEAFTIRSTEAASCYQSCNYYATCAMAGAATESVFLSIGTKILGSIEKVKKSYHATGGRKKLLKNIKDSLSSKELQDNIDNYTGMLNYWRDESTHASNNNITKFDALNSLERLLNFSRLIHTRWDLFRASTGEV